MYNENNESTFLHQGISTLLLSLCDFKTIEKPSWVLIMLSLTYRMNYVTNYAYIGDTFSTTVDEMNIQL